MDTLIKGLAHEGAIRIIVVDSTQTVKEACERHRTYPTASAALGRTLTMGAILGSMLKSDKENVMIQINGGGPLGTILVDANHNCEVRGFVANPERYAPARRQSGVTHDHHHYRHPRRGQNPLHHRKAIAAAGGNQHQLHQRRGRRGHSPAHHLHQH